MFILMKISVFAGVVSVIGALVLSAPAVLAQDEPAVSPSQRASQARAACAGFEGRKLSLVIPVKPGGGYDLVARALEPVLASHSGMEVAVTNMPGGAGTMAIRAVVGAKGDKPVVGLLDLGAFPTQVAKGQSGQALSNLVGLGILSTDHSVWLSREPLVWPQGKHSAFTGASSTGPFVRLGIPAQILGLHLKPVFGFDGSNQIWLALLRGDLDIVTMSDQSARRNLATGARAMVSLTLTDHSHVDFPTAPYLAGPGGVVDARTRTLAPAERQRALHLAALAVALSEQARTLVASTQLSPQLLSCLRSATEAALFDPALASAGKRQKFDLAPQPAQAAQVKLQRMGLALVEHRDYLRSIAAAWQGGE